MYILLLLECIIIIRNSARKLVSTNYLHEVGNPYAKKNRECGFYHPPFLSTLVVSAGRGSDE